MCGPASVPDACMHGRQTNFPVYIITFFSLDEDDVIQLPSSSSKCHELPRAAASGMCAQEASMHDRDGFMSLDAAQQTRGGL